ncbi:MAG TPA: TetR family transcriptional regulator [Kofleriaceae bacterium]|nr:TetR family transcriptional regulator [Kofleriaceae bacterium]
MKPDIKERILDVAMDLAAEGGFENVRQRDVAARAGIALGTLYKRFRSKEDILSALLEREAQALDRRLIKRPAAGDSEAARLVDYYDIVTRTLCRKPHLARAMLRAMTAGEAHAAANVNAYHGRMLGLVARAIVGADDRGPGPRELEIALILQHIWFAALVGWAAGFHTQKTVVELMARSSAVVLRGVEP